MNQHQIESLKDAHDLIRNLALDEFDWKGGGSAAGFADRLFLIGETVSMDALVLRVNNYRLACKEHSQGTDGVDAEARDDREFLESMVSWRNDVRTRTAEFVRSVRFGESGGAVWTLVARLATVRAPGVELLAVKDVRLLERLMSVLDGLVELESDWEASHHLPEHDDEFFLRCLRINVELFDEVLMKASAWDGKNDDTSYEMRALLRLAHDAAVRERIAKRLTSLLGK